MTSREKSNLLAPFSSVSEIFGTPVSDERIFGNSMNASKCLLRLLGKTLTPGTLLIKDIGFLISYQDPQTFFVKDEIVIILGFIWPISSLSQLLNSAILV